MSDPVHIEIPCDLKGLTITRELRSGIFGLEGWGRRIVVREWTWAERRRLLDACTRRGVFDRERFVTGLLALTCEPVPPEQLAPLYAHVVLGLLGIDGEVPLEPTGAAERRLAEHLGWDAAKVGAQSAVDVDRLLRELDTSESRAIRAGQAARPEPDPGWRRIALYNDLR